MTSTTSPADRHHRPPVRLRRRAAHPHSRQGRGADRHLQFLVRQAQGTSSPTSSPASRPNRWSRRSERDQVAGPRHRGEEASSRCRSKPSCAATWSARAGRNTRTAGSVCGIPLPAGLQEADKLPQPLFTPSTKAEVGAHDENISFEQAEQLLGEELAAQVRDASHRPLQGSRRLCRNQRHHHRRHQVRVRPGRRREAVPDRRGADPGLLALLARRPVPRRQQSAQLRQAVRARLAGGSAAGTSKPPARNCRRKSPPKPARNTAKR